MTNIILTEFSTTQISAFKIACEVIDNLVHDVNLEISADGIRIRETDSCAKLFLSVWFSSGNFEVYNYLSDQPKFDIGLDIGGIVTSLTQRLRYDTLRFKVYSDFSLRLELESYKRDEIKTVTLKKVESLPVEPSGGYALSPSGGSIIPCKYSHSVTLSSELFSKYCKDIIRTSHYLILKLNAHKFIISSENESLEYSINGNSKHNLQIILDTLNSPVGALQFVVSMLPSKYFSILSKLSNISELVTILIGSNPTMLKYNLGSLGELMLVVF